MNRTHKHVKVHKRNELGTQSKLLSKKHFFGAARNGSVRLSIKLEFAVLYEPYQSAMVGQITQPSPSFPAFLCCTHNGTAAGL